MERTVSKSEIRAKSLGIIGEGLSALSNESRVNITRYIQENNKVSFETIRRNLNMNNNTLNFHLQKLMKAHIISQPKDRGPYEIDPLGNEMIELLNVLESSIMELI